MLMQGGIGGSFSSRCQDCGNQAKKECVYLRCRTCCKNKGFQCQTHVKSTWIPLYRRRQKQQQLSAAVLPQHLRVRGHNPKRQSQITSYGSEEANFPAEVHLRAAFFCIRLGSVNDAAEDQYAYQTAVSIGGHLFKGILYDQGPHESNCTAGEGSSIAPQPPKLLNAADLANVTTNSAYTETLHPPIFPFPFTAFMPGTQFLQRPRS